MKLHKFTYIYLFIIDCPWKKTSALKKQVSWIDLSMTMTSSQIWENVYQRSLNQCYRRYNLALGNESLNFQSSSNIHQIFILSCPQFSQHQIINMYFLVIKNECSRKYKWFVPSFNPCIQIFNCSYRGQNAWFLESYLIFYYAKL